MADFTNNLARVNGLAERTPGFVWRHIDESGTPPARGPMAIQRSPSTCPSGRTSKRSSALSTRPFTSNFTAAARNGLSISRTGI
ncbi:MAG: DUF3291 domain-containing protein [Pseudolabrys sp.]